MNRQSLYYQQVQLLLQVLPFVDKEKCFALKGGTAINLFIRKLPRLSVDIDLVYLPMEDRNTALQRAGEALQRITDDITGRLSHLRVSRPNRSPEGLRLIISQPGGTQIKLELSPVLRGSVFPSQELEVTEAVENEFGYASIQVISFPDLYAGKICAALDRQHPRDLFDIEFLLENEGITDDLRKTFLVYLISHDRSISELLDPNRKDITAIYENEFLNMPQVALSLDKLIAAREKLIQIIRKGLTEDEKQFLLSFKNRQPDWDLLGLNNVQELPAVKWKMINLNKMSANKHQAALNKLKQVLSLP